MMRAALLSVIGVLMLGAAARAEIYIYHGNDTGGIIPWSCENEAMAQQAAAAYCARWDKYHRITSVHRQYGDFIAFKGVGDDGRSQTSGRAWVNGVQVNGRIPNEPGTIIEVLADDPMAPVPTVDEWADHVARAVALIGPTHVAIGLDLWQGHRAHHARDCAAR